MGEWEIYFKESLICMFGRNPYGNKQDFFLLVYLMRMEKVKIRLKRHPSF
jgi:hypothetical protein